MNNLKIYNVNYKYIDYLRSFPEFKGVMVHKYFLSNNGGRKYIGVVFKNNNFNYFVPIHSGYKEEIKRKCVYHNLEGKRKIRRSKIDIYFISCDKDGNEKIETVFKCDCMIPIDEKDLIEYSINDEANPITKTNFQNLYNWLTRESNQRKIISKFQNIYKTKIGKLNGTLGVNHPDYKNCDYWLSYPLLEEKLKEWIKIQEEKPHQKSPNS